MPAPAQERRGTAWMRNERTDNQTRHPDPLAQVMGTPWPSAEGVHAWSAEETCWVVVEGHASHTSGSHVADAQPTILAGGVAAPDVYFAKTPGHAHMGFQNNLQCDLLLCDTGHRPHTTTKYWCACQE